MVSLKLVVLVVDCCISCVCAAPRREEIVDHAIAKTTDVLEPTIAATHSLRNQHIPVEIQADDIESLLIAPGWTEPPHTTAYSDSISEYHQYPFSFSYMTPTTTSPLTPEATMTVTEIKEEPTTVTVTVAPATITKTITVTESSTAPPRPPPTKPNTKEEPPKATWTSPPDMSNLSSFQILKFAGGEDNMKIVEGVPAKAKGLDPLSFDDPSIFSTPNQWEWENNSTAMQLLYPANSIDPANKPLGGAEFYATPIDISDARNVTMGYSVFFPVGFDWVLGGKLPGLYGGHTGCSGGNSALNCFSTRLMWRTGGAGELYLYAPKDKQTKELCADPNSVCDAAYGLSVGRGLFNWQPGAWTTVQQTIYLNTPGKQDGHFTLMVNGEQAIFRDDILYRNEVSKKEPDKTTTKTSRTKTTSTKTHAAPTTTSTDDGDILGPLLGGLLARRRREETQPKIDLLPTPTAESVSATVTDMSMGVENAKDSEVKFVGIFFSTFFGGHESKYATPQDQYVWFKDFSLAYNA